MTPLLATFAWSGPPGSAEHVTGMMKHQGRTLAEAAALDRPQPWAGDYLEELVELLSTNIAELSVPYSEFSPDPSAFATAMQAIAREAFDERCKEIAAKSGSGGTA